MQSGGDKGGGQGGGHHRGDVGDAVGADDDLEGVEGAGERGAEGRRDPRPRSGAHEGAQIAAPQVERAAGERGQGPAQLGVGRLQPHRGAEAVGDDALDADEQAVARGHPPAVQGVGLHRVHGRLGTAPGPQPGYDPQQQTAGGEHDEARGRQGGEAGEPLAGLEAIEGDLQAAGGWRSPPAVASPRQPARRRRRSPPAKVRWRGCRRRRIGQDAQAPMWRTCRAPRARRARLRQSRPGPLMARRCAWRR